MTKGEKPVSNTWNFLLAVGHLIAPIRMSKDRIKHIENTVFNAQYQADNLAKDLNTIADTELDPFKEFAERARHSQFKRILGQG